MEHAEIVSTLVDLQKHPGWKIVTDRYEEGLKQIVKDMLDQSTPDEITLRIKHAHGLVEEADPQKLCTKLINHHRTFALKEAKAVTESAATDGNQPAT